MIQIVLNLIDSMEKDDGIHFAVALEYPGEDISLKQVKSVLTSVAAGLNVEEENEDGPEL